VIKILERIILICCATLIFIRLFLLWRLISFLGPSHNIDLGLIVDLPTQAINLFIYAIFFLFLIKLVLERHCADFNMPVAILLSAMALVSCVSFIYSVNKDSTLRFTLELLANIYLFFIISNCLKAPLRRNIFICLLLAAGVITAIKGLYHYFFIYDYALKQLKIPMPDYRINNFFELKRLSTFFGWPNLMAGFLCMILPLAVSCFALVKNARHKIYLCIIFSLIFLATLFTYSIGGNLSLFIAALITAVLYAGGKLIPKTVPAKIMLAVMVLVVFFSATALISKRSDKLTQGSFSARRLYLEKTISMIKSSPLFGTGAGTFKDVFPNYITNPTQYAAHAHNSFLEFWADLGITGFLLFLSFYAYVIYRIASCLKREKDKTKRLFLAGLFCSALAFLLHNTVDFTIFAPMVSFYWWVIIAIAFSQLQEQPALTNKNFIKKFFVPFGFFLVIVSSVFLGRQFAADVYFFNVQKYKNSSQNINLAIKYLKISRRLNPFDYKYARILGSIYFNGFKDTSSADLLDKAIKECESYIQLNKVDAAGYYNLAVIYSIKGEKDLASQLYSKALQYNPKKDLPPLPSRKGTE